MASLCLNAHMIRQLPELDLEIFTDRTVRDPGRSTVTFPGTGHTETV